MQSFKEYAQDEHVEAARKLIRFGPFTVDLEERELRRSGARVPLQQKPFRILEILLRRPGALISRRELAKELWPGLHVDFERSLNSAVNTLRQALEDSPRASQFIETRWGLGYRFVAPIEEAEAPANRSRTEAHHDYLRGRLFLNKMTTDAIQRAISFFRAALGEVPDFALAHSGLADAYCQSALGGTVCASEVCGCARNSARAGLSSEPDLAEAHVSMGRVHLTFDWDWNKATECWNRAADLNPQLPDVYHARAMLLAARNCPGDALRAITHAQELDPLSLPIGFEHARILYLSGHFHEAIAQAWRVLTIEPSFAAAQSILGLAHFQLGDWEDALIELENACACSGRHPSALAALGHIYAAGGSVEMAHAVLDELAARSQRQHVARYWFAVIHAGLNDRKLALQELRHSCSVHEPLFLWMGVDPRLFSLHADNDFAKLRDELNFGV